MAFRKRDYLHWLLGVILCTLAIVIWVVMDARESALRDARIQEEATNHMDYIQTDMRTKLPALQNIANEWNAQAGLGKEVFEKQVMQILREMSGFQAIALADQNNYIRWVFPELENELLLNLDLTFEERRRIALELAKRRKAVSMTDPVELISGGAGVIVFIPLQKKDVFDGFIVAVFRIEDWLDNVFSQYSTGKQRAHFRIAVQIDAVPVYTQESFNEDGVAALAHVVEAPLNGHQIRVICRPTKLFVDTSSNKVNEAVGVGGVLLAILITLLIHFWLRTKEFMSKPSLAKLLAEESKSFAASHANQESTPGNGDAPTLSTARDTFHIEELQSQINDLEKQNQEIPMLQQRLAGVTLSLALATRAGRVGVWILDLATKSCKWNEMMNELHNCKTGEVQGQDAWLQLIHPEDKGEFEKALANAIETNRLLNICFRVVLKDGTEKTMRAMGRVETNADKKTCTG
jgi:sensor domain CHASE-containing protein